MNTACQTRTKMFEKNPMQSSNPSDKFHLDSMLLIKMILFYIIDIHTSPANQYGYLNSYLES